MNLPLYHGYAVMVSTFIFRFVGIGIYYSGGLFITPFIITFEVDTATAASYVSIYASLSLASPLLCGYIQDCLNKKGYSIRLVFVFGSVMEFLGIMGMSISKSFGTVLLSSCCMGIGIGFTAFSSSGVMAQWFPDKGVHFFFLAHAGSGIGGFSYAHVVTFLLERFHTGEELCNLEATSPTSCQEWRPVLRCIGIFSFVAILLASLSMRVPTLKELEEFTHDLKNVEEDRASASSTDITLEHDSSEGKERHDRDLEISSNLENSSVSLSQEDEKVMPLPYHLSFVQVIQTRTSILLCIWAFFNSIPIDAFYVFFPTYADSIGLSPREAGTVLSITGIAIVIGNITLAKVVNDFGYRSALLGCMAGLVVIMIVWPFCNSFGVLVALAFSVGFFTSAENIFPPFLTSTYSNLTDCILTHIGFVSAFHAPGIFLGPIIIGRIIDRHGFHEAAFFCASFFAVTVISVFLIPSKEKQMSLVMEKFDGDQKGNDIDEIRTHALKE